MKNRRLILILLTASVLLLIPYIAMQIYTGVDWSFKDFTSIGILLFGAGLACELTIRIVKNVTNRIIICFTILVVLFLIWAELAVGIVGTPFAGS